MKNYKSIVFGIIIFMIIASCSIREAYQDDEFILEKTDYTGNELRINGYFHSDISAGGNYILYVLYRNGIILFPGGSDNPEETIDGFVEEFNSDSQTFWGLFQIKDNTIKIEYYMPKMYEGLPAYIKAGEILNDTTFVFREQYRSKDNSEYQEINETYHFKQYSPKPDSTNSFF